MEAAANWELSSKTRETADHSIPYELARTLRNGTIDEESFAHYSVVGKSRHAKAPYIFICKLRLLRNTVSCGPGRRQNFRLLQDSLRGLLLQVRGIAVFA